MGVGLYLAVLVRVSASQFVQLEQVRGWNDDEAELAQIAVLVIIESQFAIIVNSHLTPHTPARTHTHKIVYSLASN